MPTNLAMTCADVSESLCACICLCMFRTKSLLVTQVLDEAALKVLKAAEATKQLLQEKEEVLAEIRGEFEQKNKEVSSEGPAVMLTILSTQLVCMPLSQSCQLHEV